MKVEVSFTIPMNMLPMLGIAIFVACGRTTRAKTRTGWMPSASPASRWPRGIALERRAVDLRDERAVEQDERDHAGLEHGEADADDQRHAEVHPDHADERGDAAEDVDVDHREPRERWLAHPRERQEEPDRGGDHERDRGHLEGGQQAVQELAAVLPDERPVVGGDEVTSAPRAPPR